MRLITLFSLMVLLIGMGAAQDTNFSTGPQYLMNYGSPLFLHSIATPTLSLSAPPASAPVAATEVGAGEQTVTVPAGVQNRVADLPRIYWGGPKVSENAGEKVSEIELSSQQPAALPASILDLGVGPTVNAPSLGERGYGMSLAEAAAFWKTHKTRVSHLYTNADIARLHGG